MKKDEEIGWHRVGENINYYNNTYKRDCAGVNRFNRTYYTFTFTHTFEYDNDQ